MPKAIASMWMAPAAGTCAGPTFTSAATASAGGGAPEAVPGGRA